MSFHFMPPELLVLLTDPIFGALGLAKTNLSRTLDFKTLGTEKKLITLSEDFPSAK